MNVKSRLRSILFSIKDMAWPRHEGDEAQRMIADLVDGPSPAMIARFGAVEIKAILPPPYRQIFKSYTFKHLGNNAGFFPVDDEHIMKFTRRMVEDMKELDLLASWRPEEMIFRKQLKNVERIPLGSLGPIDDSTAWSRVLKGKRVLVVHPFAETIEKQYRNHRSQIWKNDSTLPELASLETVKAVQTIAGTKDARFETWFDALLYMEQEIEKHDFDVALIGCGAYGFPLAAHVKRLGKKAVHIGGPLQLFFGIKGKRWDNMGLYNESWVSPSSGDRPKGLNNVEGGCYW